MIDWKGLSPHRPLDEGDPRYVARPDGGGERLAQLLSAGGGPIAVAGPAGCGKSTEVAQAARLLMGRFEVCLVQLDRRLDMRNVTEDQALQAIAQEIRSKAPMLSEVANRAATVAFSKVFAGSSLLDRIRNAVRIGPRRYAFLIDGLEKCPQEQAQEIVQAILELADDCALVLVVPPSLVTGPSAYRIVNQVRVFAMRALPYWEVLPFRKARLKDVDEPIVVDEETFRLAISHLPAPEEQNSVRVARVLRDLFNGRPISEIAPGPAEPFLASVLNRRLGLSQWPAPWAEVLRRAIIASGGLARTFLQLMQDAATYATLAGREMPTLEDLGSAIADQTDNIALLLQDGDADSLARAFGTNGLEVPLERKLRFLTHGLLLEYELGDDKEVYPAPLLFKYIRYKLDHDL